MPLPVTVSLPLSPLLVLLNTETLIKTRKKKMDAENSRVFNTLVNCSSVLGLLLFLFLGPNECGLQRLINGPFWAKYWRVIYIYIQYMTYIVNSRFTRYFKSIQALIDSTNNTLDGLIG